MPAFPTNVLHAKNGRVLHSDLQRSFTARPLAPPHACDNLYGQVENICILLDRL